MKKRFLSLIAILPALLVFGCNSGDDSSDSTLTSESSSDSSSSSTPSKEWEEVLNDGDVYVSTFPENIIVGTTISYEIDLDFSTTIYNAECEIETSDEDLLPASALKFHAEGNGSLVTSGYVTIDASNLTEAGMVYVELDISSPNSSSQGGTVCVALDLVEYTAPTYWTETLIIDDNGALKNLELDEGYSLLIQISDSDHVIGTSNPNREGEENDTYAWFTRDVTSVISSDDPVTFTFSYAEGHRYTANVYLENAEGYVENFYTMLDSLGQGSSETGFNSYDHETKALKFIADGAELNLTITDETYN